MASPSRSVLVVLAVAGFAGAVAVAQEVSPERPKGIALSGSVKKAQAVDAAAVAGFPRHAFLAKVRGPARYRGTFATEGVALKDLLEKAEVAKATNDSLDRPLDLAVVVTGRDGYRSLYSGGEILLSRFPENVLLVDTEDGKPLFRKSGRLKSVVRGDFFVDRAVRNLAEVRVVLVP